MRRVRAHLTPLPDLRQEEPAECGAVCLALALASFGRAVPVSETRVACNVSRDGASALDLVRAAERYGLVARPVSGDAAAVLDLPMPAIVLLADQHFALLTDATPSRVRMADPAAGTRRMDRQAFARLFAGVAIALAPGPSFRRGGPRPQTRSGPRRGLLLWGLLVPPQFLASWLIADAIVDGLRAGTAPPLGIVASAIAACALAGGIQAILRDRWTRRDVVLAAAASLSHGLELPVEAWERHHSLGLAAAVTDRGRAARGSIDRLFRHANLMLALASLITVTIEAPAPGAVALVLAALLWLGATLLGRGLSVASSGQAAAERSVARRLAETLPVLAGLRSGSLERDLFDAAADRVEDAERRRSAFFGWWLAGWLPPLFGFAGYAGVIVLAGDSLPLHAAALLLVGTAPWLLGMAQGDETAEHRPAIEPGGHPPIAPVRPGERPAGRLRAEALAYARPGAPPCLSGLALDIAPGERVALVGASGSGKSTLLEILSGLRLPQAGQVWLDGTAIQTLPAERRAFALGLFGQDIAFFDASLRANLAALDEGVPDDSITEVAERLGLHERIVRRRQGYRTNLAGDAPQFSGGERALIELARLLILAPPVLLLDEPTAALDADTENRAWQAILAGGATVLIATHSPPIAAACDRSLLLAEGRIVASGPHEMLLATEPAYRRVIGDA